MIKIQKSKPNRHKIYLLENCPSSTNNREVLICNDYNISISNLKKHEESKEYEACTFNLENKSIVFRKAKATPTKLRHFVTIWQRKNSITSPYGEGDRFDYLIISVKDGVNFGQFVFDKQALTRHSIISSKNKNGKRGCAMDK